MYFPWVSSFLSGASGFKSTNGLCVLYVLLSSAKQLKKASLHSNSCSNTTAALSRTYMDNNNAQSIQSTKSHPKTAEKQQYYTYTLLHCFCVRESFTLLYLCSSICKRAKQCRYQRLCVLRAYNYFKSKGKISFPYPYTNKILVRTGFYSLLIYKVKQIVTVY